MSSKDVGPNGWPLWNRPDWQREQEMSTLKFRDEYLGELDLRYMKLALEVWDAYEERADFVRCAADYFNGLAAQSFDEAREKGFTGDVRQWRRCIRDAPEGRP
jgi:hypothetical protein